MSDLPLRVAHRETIVGLLDMIPSEDTLPETDDTSFPHLRWMMNRCLEHLFVWPIDKISRWIGCVQGVMRCRGVLDFSAERDRTRPIFHKAYAATGQVIPETAERQVGLDHPLAGRIDNMMQTGQDAEAKMWQAIAETLGKNTPHVTGYKNGNPALLSYLVGQVMKRLHGSGNPTVIQDHLKAILDR